MQQKKTTKEEYQKCVNVVVEYINQHLGEDIDLKSLARISNFSPFYFHRIMKAFLGEPIGTFIVRTRTEAYSNEVKMSLLHVSAETLEKYGAVSRETVIEMVKGAMKALKTDCAVATSGIAGPGGGTAEKPVGTVWIAAAYKNEIVTFRQEGDDGRGGNVQKAIQNALMMLCECLK